MLWDFGEVGEWGKCAVYFLKHYCFVVELLVTYFLLIILKIVTTEKYAVGFVV